MEPVLGAGVIFELAIGEELLSLLCNPKHRGGFSDD